MSYQKILVRGLFFAFILLPFISAAQSIAGNWETKFTANGESYVLTLRIAGEPAFDFKYSLHKGNSVLSGSFDGYYISGDAVHFIFPDESEMSSAGQINDAYNKIIGNVTLEGKDYPATFIKTADATQQQELIVTDSNGQEIIISGDPANTNNNDGFIDLVAEGGSQPAEFNYRPLLVWLSFWIIICLLLWMRFRKSKRSFMPGPGE